MAYLESDGSVMTWLAGSKRPPFVEHATAPAHLGGIGQVAFAAIGDLGVGQAFGLHGAVGRDIFHTNGAADLDDLAALAQCELFLAAYDQIAVAHDFDHGDRNRASQRGGLTTFAGASAGDGAVSRGYPP